MSSPLNIDSLTWMKQIPEGVAQDSRSDAARNQTVMKAKLVLKDIKVLFFYMVPDDRRSLLLDPTNPMLQGHDQLNLKLTQGELLRWWG
ncbi:MAG: hypothetical protein SGPRY_008802 [Prymnesium sp.]